MKTNRISAARDSITPQAIRESSARLVPSQSVLVVTRSGILAHSLPVAITSRPVAINQDIKALIPSATVAADFVRLFLKAHASDILETCVKAGTTVASVNFSRFLDVTIALPSLAEQHMIVARVENLLFRVAQVHGDVERVSVLTKRYKRQFLAAMFPDNTQWPARPLGDLTVNRDGRRVPLKASDRARRPGQYPYYGASGQIDTIDEFLFEGEHLLVSEDGANLLGRATPVAFIAHGRFWVNNHAHVLAGGSDIDLSYLKYFIESLDLGSYVTGSAQPKLTQRALSSILVPVPPLAQQVEIAARIERALCSTTTAANDAGRATPLLRRFEKSILDKAFRGDTLPDVPA